MSEKPVDDWVEAMRRRVSGVGCRVSAPKPETRDPSHGPFAVESLAVDLTTALPPLDPPMANRIAVSVYDGSFMPGEDRTEVRGLVLRKAASIAAGKKLNSPGGVMVNWWKRYLKG